MTLTATKARTEPGRPRSKAARVPLVLQLSKADCGAACLAIARALARGPRLLVLDEATSHLDSATEQAITARLRELNCTQVVIAHRIGTIRDSDLIIVLHQGALVEAGTHDELLRRGGRSAALVHAQLGDDAVAGGPQPGAARAAGEQTAERR